MRAKEFLRQIQKLNCWIQNKLIEKNQWLDVATGITSKLDGERVQTSGDKQKMASAIDKIIDIEREIDETIDQLIGTKNDVIAVIEQLDVFQYDLLHQRYVQGLELKEIALNMKKSYSYITGLHSKALCSVQKILDSNKKQEKV